MCCWCCGDKDEAEEAQEEAKHKRVEDGGLKNNLTQNPTLEHDQTQQQPRITKLVHAPV